MDLSTKGLQKGQRQAIESKSAKLFISAGAGTGKTHTLTQKIAWMFAEDSGAPLEEMGDLLAITFTNAAASELVGRVRSVLRSEGMSEMSMQIDSAWISTIHGMCSRILRDYALELGIDPGFTIITGQAQEELLALAIEDALKEVDGTELSDLFEAYPVRKKGGLSVTGMAKTLSGLMASAPEGAAEPVRIGPPPAPAEVLADNLRVLFGQSLEMYDERMGDEPWGIPDARASYVSFIEELGKVGAAEEAQRFQVLQKALDSAPVNNLTKKPWNSKEYKAQANDEREALAEAKEMVSRHYLGEFVRFAAIVRSAYALRKRFSGYLDNDDLLGLMHAALANHPEIRERYAEQFKLIMVDEFQDTDWLQFDSIRMLMGPETQRCTVGDAQQSIYRFRGADVSLFTQTGAEEGVEVAKLDVNFRSHPAILGFVNDVFEAPFKDTFLRLRAPEGYREKFYPEDLARVEVVQCTYGTGTRVDQARACEAAAIAERFACIRAEHEAAGHAAPKMVVLLGGMTNAGVYADALRARGFDAVVTGGSGFWSSDEVAVVANLLRVFSNPLDDEALLRVLLGPVFAVTPDDIATVAFHWIPSSDGTGEAYKRRPLWEGLRALVAGESADRASEECRFAAGVLIDACLAAATRRVDEALAELFADSGWAARLALDADGRAMAANVLKAIRVVKTIVDDPAYGSCGDAATVSRAFSSLLEGDSIKEPPGSLSSEDSGVVELMTIHASKGLQFPVVAIAEFSSTGRTGSFVSETNAGERWAAFPIGGLSGEDMGDISFADALEGCRSYHDYAQRLTALVAREDEMEQWRKFYVAATRAEQSMIVVFAEKPSSKSPGPKSPINRGILEALGLLGDNDEMPSADCSFMVESGFAGKLWALPVETDDAGDFTCPTHPEISPVRAEAASGALTVPVPADARALSFSVPLGDMMSYSKMARMLPARLPEDADADATAAKVVDKADDSATSLGSAFHRVMEYLIESGAYAGDGTSLEMPSRQRVDALVREFGLSDDARMRLDAALLNWQEEVRAGLLDGWFGLRAEVPFSTALDRLGGRGHWYLEGSIDALAEDGKGGVLIIDYKTGYPHAATEDQMLEDHRLQATVYADAVFSGRQDVQVVEAVFARVEHLDGQGRIRKACYRFARADGDDQIARSDLLMLRERI